MGQIEDLRAFVTVVGSGAIARAEEMRGIAKSALSRRLAQLENRDDMRLIDRQLRMWDVTAARRNFINAPEPWSPMQMILTRISSIRSKA